MKDCICLGTILTDKNELGSEIEKELQMQIEHIALLCLLKSHKVLRAEKIKIYMTLKIPVVIYKAESWTWNKDIANWLGTFESKVLRQMFGGIKVNENWRKQDKKELMQLFGDLNVLSFVRISWLN